jgi:uncharacterized protein YuzE
MENRHLDARGKGEYSYDYRNDLLLFKIKDREYSKSIEFDNLVVDIDKEGFITGLRVFDASKIFRLTKVALNKVTDFEFYAKIEDKIITIQLKFRSVLRNRPILSHGQDFVREAINAKIRDSDVVCTVA